MILSVVIAFRNNAKTAANVLRTTLRALRQLGLGDVEFVLIDDHSDPTHGIPQLLREFRAQLPADARMVELHFKEHQHYSRALAQGFSIARGEQVLFVSHDMMVTAPYIQGLLDVASLDPSFGLVRGTSTYVDCFPEHTFVPPFPVTTLEQLDAFANYVRSHFQQQWVEDRLLTGDSMLIKREVFNRIGVFDPRYFGYFGDIDFGLRLQRAGFKMVCAKGAWLWHEGAAAYTVQAPEGSKEYASIHAARMRVVAQAYQLFREKWDPSLPADYRGHDALPLDALRKLPAKSERDFQPSVAPDPRVCEIR
jgi:GT2 family glycosyltransferase